MNKAAIRISSDAREWCTNTFGVQGERLPDVVRTYYALYHHAPRLEIDAADCISCFIGMFNPPHFAPENLDTLQNLLPEHRKDFSDWYVQEFNLSHDANVVEGSDNET